MQGRLRDEALSFLITTECCHCSRPIHIEIDADLKYRVQEPDADPLVFTPAVNFNKLSGPSIIDDF